MTTKQMLERPFVFAVFGFCGGLCVSGMWEQASLSAIAGVLIWLAVFHLTGKDSNDDSSKGNTGE